jgi:hypothetical protein
MSFLSWSTRTVLVAVSAATVASCEYVAAVFEDDFPTEKIGDAYAARDSCLKWTVAMADDGVTDAAEVGARVARSCSAETGALVSTTDPHGDPVVASKIHADSVFRATSYIIRSRNAASDIAQKR